MIYPFSVLRLPIQWLSGMRGIKELEGLSRLSRSTRYEHD